MDNPPLVTHPLDSVFGTPRARVLDALLGIDDALSVRHVAQLAGLSPTTASAALSALERLGLVDHTEVGRSHLYRLNGDHAFVPALARLVGTARQLDVLLVPRLLKALGDPSPEAVILFGSAARGEAGLDSDLDLLVVGSSERDVERWRARRPRAEAVLGRFLGRAVQLALTPRPTAREARSPFWRAVLREGRALHGPSPKELVR